MAEVSAERLAEEAAAAKRAEAQRAAAAKSVAGGVQGPAKIDEEKVRKTEGVREFGDRRRRGVGSKEGEKE